MIININDNWGGADLISNKNNILLECYLYDCDAYNYDIAAEKRALHQKELYKRLLEYIFSRKYIVENYIPYALFYTHCDFVNDELFKKPLDKYWFLKRTFKGEWFKNLQELQDEFIYYKFHSNNDELFFRAVIMFEYLKKFENKETDAENFFKLNQYSENLYLIPKTQSECINDFINMKHNELNNFFKKHINIFISSSFTDETGNVGVELSGNGVHSLYKEIQEDFKKIDKDNYEWISNNCHWYMYRQNYAYTAFN
ncbi:MAG: hypothetical protein IJR46_00230 [Neisseriaceae bacterium]|nr:hypothetical protein [Neisseriaceae bacterium]